MGNAIPRQNSTLQLVRDALGADVIVALKEGVLSRASYEDSYEL